MELRHVRIVGNPGSGRTTLLALLYAYLVQQSTAEEGSRAAYRFYADPESVRKGGDLYRRLSQRRGGESPVPPLGSITLEIGRGTPSRLSFLRKKDPDGGDPDRVRITFSIPRSDGQGSNPQPTPPYPPLNPSLPVGQPVKMIDLLVHAIPRETTPGGGVPGKVSNPEGPGSAPPVPPGSPPSIAPFAFAMPGPGSPLVLTQWDVALRSEPDLKLGAAPPALEDVQARRELAESILDLQAGGAGRVRLPPEVPIYFFGLSRGGGPFSGTAVKGHHVDFATYVPREADALLARLLGLRRP